MATAPLVIVRSNWGVALVALIALAIFVFVVVGS
jgi:hypothetical protein